MHSQCAYSFLCYGQNVFKKITNKFEIRIIIKIRSASLLWQRKTEETSNTFVHSGESCLCNICQVHPHTHTHIVFVVFFVRQTPQNRYIDKNRVSGESNVYISSVYLVVENLQAVDLWFTFHGGNKSSYKHTHKHTKP